MPEDTPSGQAAAEPLLELRNVTKTLRKVAAEILDEVVAIRGIDSPDKLVGSLSGGQRQAVAIARALHFGGLSSVLVTHDLFDAYRVCDRFVVMSHGKVALEATREQTSIEELIQTVSLS